MWITICGDAHFVPIHCAKIWSRNKTVREKSVLYLLKIASKEVLILSPLWGWGAIESLSKNEGHRSKENHKCSQFHGTQRPLALRGLQLKQTEFLKPQSIRNVRQHSAYVLKLRYKLNELPKITRLSRGRARPKRNQFSRLSQRSTTFLENTHSFHTS